MKRLYIPLPDASARKHIVVNLMKQQPFLLSEEELEDICKQSDGTCRFTYGDRLLAKV